MIKFECENVKCNKDDAYMDPYNTGEPPADWLVMIWERKHYQFCSLSCLHDWTGDLIFGTVEEPPGA